MFFLGLMTVGYVHSADITPTNIKDLNVVTIKNQICDDLIIKQDTISLIPPLSSIWDANTVLIAKFENSLIAGNVGILLNQIDNIRISYREIGSYNWTIFADIPIKVSSDLIFTRFNRFCRANTTYEFSLSTMLNGVVSEIVTNTVESSFNGIYIMEKDSGYHTNLNVKITPTRNRISSILNTLTGKYPVTIINSENNYDTFTVEGLFIQQDSSGEYLKSTAWQYRNLLKNFLFDGLPKFVKNGDGRAWVTNIYDNIPDDESQATAEGYTMTTFSCVECGNTESTQDLVDCNLVDINTSYYY